MKTRLWAMVLAACAARAQTVTPAVLLRARVIAHATHELERVPNYTCLETISRFRRESRSRIRMARVMAPLDTVRLEIVYSDGHEWYGSPGERNLASKNPAEFVGGGMIGNGAFASLLHNVLAAAQLRYAGEETVAGRKAVRIDFVLPRSTKSLTVSLQQGQGVVGQEGSLWADAASLDLIAVDSHVTEIPPYLPLVDSETNMKYARMRIGQYDVVMAQEAESHMMGTDGVESFNRIEFTHCRAYSAQSEIRFDAPAPASGDSVTGSARPPEKEAARVVEPFMLMPMELTTPVSDRDAVGTLIEARVREDVLRKGAVAIPKGSVVRGRVRRMERYRDGNAYIVALEFSEVEVRGVSMPFYAGLLRIEKNPRIRMELRERVVVPGGGTQEQRVTLPELAGVAPFFVSGEAVSLPRGFQMEWRTRGPIAGVDKK